MLESIYEDLESLLEDNKDPFIGEKAILRGIRKLVDFSLSNFSKAAMEKSFPQLLTLRTIYESQKKPGSLAEGLGQRLG
jgi:hypothetical protein